MQIVTNIRWADNTQELAQNLKGGIDQIEAMRGAADRLTTRLGGDGLLRASNTLVASIDQLGGVTKLTSGEQDKAANTLDKAIAKYQALGRTAPTAMIQTRDALREASDASGGFTKNLEGMGLGFVARTAEGVLLRDVIREFIGFTKDAIQETGRIADMAKAWGTTTEDVQRFIYVGSEFDLEAEDMGKSVEKLSGKLAGGDKNAVSAVSALGLSIKDLLAKGPKEAFLDITEALGRIEDPMTRNAMASDLFGEKVAKKLLPALGELRQKMNEVPKDAIISDLNVQRADRFDDALHHLIIRVKAWSVTAVGASIDVTKAMIAGAAASGLAESGISMEQLKTADATKAATAANVDHAKSQAPVLTNAQLIAN